MKVTWTKMQYAAAACFAVTIASGKISEKKNSIRAAKAVVIFGVAGMALTLVADYLYEHDKIEF